MDEDEPPTSRRRLSQGESDATDFMEILAVEHKSNRSRKTRQSAFTLKFTATPATALDPKAQMVEAFTALFNRIFAVGEPRPAKILVQFFPPNFERPFCIPLRPMEQNNPDAIAEQVMQLNEQYNADLDLFNGLSEFRLYAVWPLEANAGKFLK